MKKDLISVLDLAREDVEDLFEIVKYFKNDLWINFTNHRKSLALIFEKPSLRTRLSFEVAMTQLSGNAIYFAPNDVGLGKRESLYDVAKTLSGQADAIAARTFKHSTILELARYAEIPVINALSDAEHPCQALADFLTIKEYFGATNVKLAYIGDGNNVCHSLMLLGALLGTEMHIVHPAGYGPRTFYIEKSREISKKTEAEIHLNCNKWNAVKNAHVIYTDTWTSMGQEGERNKRIEIFKGYQVNKALLENNAHKNYQVMHCLPAHREEEITSEVMDNKEHSLIWKQAENRLYIAKALLFKMLN